MSQISIRPQTGRQEHFLSSPADICIYGGAAGGGKTWALLLEPARHLANKEFGAVVFRRSHPEITNEGGMWDESKKIYNLLGGRALKGMLTWEFPKGSKIRFAHLQYEETLEDWKGAQIPLIEFDQLETFTERQFFYMLSRNRSTCGVKPYVRATCNPEPGWLADFLSWWIAEDGYADLSRAGVMRWMIRRDEKIVWADTKEELLSQFGEESCPLSVTFIPATVYDNRILLAKDPGYLAKMKAQSLVDRERLLGDAKRGGNWKIKPSAGKVINRGWFKMMRADQLPVGGVACRFWDFAATEKELKKNDPDFTASVLMLQVDGAFYILSMMRGQLGPAEVDRQFMNVTRQDVARFLGEKRRYLSRWEIEPGSAGKRESFRMTRELAGVDAKGARPSGDKVTRVKPAAVQAEAGNVFVVEGDWNETFFNQLHGFPELAHDDVVDAFAGVFASLTNPFEQKEAKSFQG